MSPCRWTCAEHRRAAGKGGSPRRAAGTRGRWHARVNACSMYPLLNVCCQRARDAWAVALGLCVVFLSPITRRRQVECLISFLNMAPKDSHASAERRAGSPRSTIWRGTMETA
eukprot:4980164-Prymnesium_polylepis.1